MSDYSIFKPKSSRGIFNDYPDLRGVPEFKGLSNNDMLFVWFYACESSPHFTIENDKDRVDKALEDSYFKDGMKRMTQVDREKFLSGKFPDKIRLAIDRMNKYKVNPRIRAKKILEKGFENLEKILDINAGDISHFLNKDGEVDFSKKKAYVDTLDKATNLMPNLITQLENGFNLTDEKDKSKATFEGESLLDNYHEEQKD